MPNIVGVVFHKGGKIYDFDAGALELARGDQVIVETVRGTELGTVTVAPFEGGGAETAAPLKVVLRRATAQDLETLASHSALRTEALATCRKLIAKHGLQMKLVDAEVMFGGGKLVFSFFAEERIDFRALVVDLAKALKMRIELRQIGVRDEARMFGGLGPCGRHLCCTLFQVDQEPVSIRMAKEQNLPLNPMKISGLCGRLMCCLKYEQEQYVAFRKEAPRRGTLVSCPRGEGVVAGYQVPKDSIVIKLADGTFVEERADLVHIVGADWCGGEERSPGTGGDEAEGGGRAGGGDTKEDIGAAETGAFAAEAPEVAMAAGEGPGVSAGVGVGVAGSGEQAVARSDTGGMPGPGVAQDEPAIEAETGAARSAGAAAVGGGAGAGAEGAGEDAGPGGLGDGSERVGGARGGGRGSRRSRRDRGTAEREGARGEVAERGDRAPSNPASMSDSLLDEAAALRAGEEPEEGEVQGPGDRRRPRRRRRRSKSAKPVAEGDEGAANADGRSSGGGSERSAADD